MSKPDKKGLRVTLKKGQSFKLKKENVTLKNVSNNKVRLIVSSDDTEVGGK